MRMDDQNGGRPPVVDLRSDALAFIYEQMECIRVRAEIAARYIEIGDLVGLDYATKHMVASMRAIAPIVKTFREPPPVSPDDTRDQERGGAT